MKTIFSFFCIFTSLMLTAQDVIQTVLVETYYIADSKDASDTTGGGIEPGSVTYRIFVKLDSGCKLAKIYGDSEHPLVFSSTKPFFNNIDFGKTFAKDFTKNNYKKNTVALDSWLTIGQTTKKSTQTYFGIPKMLDSDGSFIGGTNNDGGSEEIEGGLLTNFESSMQLPLKQADGMDTLSTIPTNWSDFGFSDLQSGLDTTIFGINRKNSTLFFSKNAFIQNSGVMKTSVQSDLSENNYVLVGQLTTAGELSFRLNLEVITATGESIRYVADGDISNGEKICPQLSYPPQCGCTDPNYIEYDRKYTCSVQDSCKNKIVLGCMDPNACNFDPTANSHIQSLCCYPGSCQDRDISLVCPELNTTVFRVTVFPNPAENAIFIETKGEQSETEEIHVRIFDSFGSLKTSFTSTITSSHSEIPVNISDYPKGVYMLNIIHKNETSQVRFIKN